MFLPKIKWSRKEVTIGPFRLGVLIVLGILSYQAVASASWNPLHHANNQVFNVIISSESHCIPPWNDASSETLDTIVFACTVTDNNGTPDNKKDDTDWLVILDPLTKVFERATDFETKGWITDIDLVPLWAEGK